MQFMQNNKTSSAGFSLVEIVIVVPIVLLVIGAFITAIIATTGNVLTERANSALLYNIQDALGSIERDVDSSTAFLDSITASSPQGYNNDTTSFSATNTAQGKPLIIQMPATTSNPSSTDSRNLVYMSGQPYGCSSAKKTENTPLLITVVYFVRDNTLWKRTFVPTTTTCETPWQLASCTPGYTNTTVCKTEDVKLAYGITSLNTVYYASADATTAAASASVANTASVTLNATQTVAGRDVSQSSSARLASNRTIPAEPAPVFSGASQDGVINIISWSGTSGDVYQITVRCPAAAAAVFLTNAPPTGITAAYGYILEWENAPAFSCSLYDATTEIRRVTGSTYSNPLTVTPSDFNYN